MAKWKPQDTSIKSDGRNDMVSRVLRNPISSARMMKVHSEESCVRSYFMPSDWFCWSTNSSPSVGWMFCFFLCGTAGPLLVGEAPTDFQSVLQPSNWWRELAKSRIWTFMFLVVGDVAEFCNATAVNPFLCSVGLFMAEGMVHYATYSPDSNRAWSWNVFACQTPFWNLFLGLGSKQIGCQAP